MDRPARIEVRRAEIEPVGRPLATIEHFQYLMARGRQFAATPEGQHWAAILAPWSILHAGFRLFAAMDLDYREAHPPLPRVSVRAKSANDE